VKLPDWPSAVERTQIERALIDKDIDRMTIVVESGSPWLQVKVWGWQEGEYELALWRRTGAVHEIDSMGAVKDDPIIPASWNMETL
jgi:hypothetical protein